PGTGEHPQVRGGAHARHLRDLLGGHGSVGVRPGDRLAGRRLGAVLSAGRLAPAVPADGGRPAALARAAATGRAGRAMTLMRGLGRFLYGLFIGDDWRITASVVASLVVGFLLLQSALPSALVAILIAV